MSKPQVVVDASVVLAVSRLEFLDKEVLSGAVLSAVNLAEVVAKTVELSIPFDRLQEALSLLMRIEPFTERQARRSICPSPSISFAKRHSSAIPVK